MTSIGRFCLIVSMLVPGAASCGPPFTTDDPGIVETGHVELLGFHQSTLAEHERSGVLAGMESHFGIVKNVELDLVTPLAFSLPDGGAMRRGYGDTTLGLKYQLQEEAADRPLVSVVPRVNFATGDAGRGLGNGASQIFVGVAAQKRFGEYMGYGSVGYWVNHGAGNRDYAFAGVVMQRDLGSHWTLGVEVFANGSTASDRPASLGFNAGGYYRLDEHDQVLFSAGRGLVHASDTNRASAYVGYQHAF